MDLPRDFGPYRLIRQVAVGGMAEIYLAKTVGFGGFEKQLALKMIHPKFSEDDHFINMLIEEAKISVQLAHVNIGQTFDLGRIDDVYYIAMEFIEGVDLFTLMRRASEIGVEVPIDSCVHIASEVATGLDYAHRKTDAEGTPLGIIHRDVSPQNVLISNAGEVKLVDFGIAKAELRAQQTEVGVIKGKYYYMSPEQAWGDPVDHRTDIFSAGIITYEMLTGQMLYLEDNLEILFDRVRKAEIKPPSTLREDIPPELDDLVMKALAKYPGERYDTARDFAQALDGFLHGFSPDFTPTRLSGMLAWLFEEDSSSRDARVDPSTDEEKSKALLSREEFEKDRAIATGSLLFDRFEIDGIEATSLEPPGARQPEDATSKVSLASLAQRGPADSTSVVPPQEQNAALLARNEGSGEAPGFSSVVPAAFDAGEDDEWSGDAVDATKVDAKGAIFERFASQLSGDLLLSGPQGSEGRQLNEETQQLEPGHLLSVSPQDEETSPHLGDGEAVQDAGGTRSSRPPVLESHSPDAPKKSTPSPIRVPPPSAFGLPDRVAPPILEDGEGGDGADTAPTRCSRGLSVPRSSFTTRS